MKKPVIGIGSDVLTEAGERDRATMYLTYVEAVRRSGALPVIIPPQGENAGELLRALDGLLLAGGGDCDPAEYGEAKHPSVDLMDSRRQSNDLELARAAREQGLPTLGICLGMQVLNIAARGTLIQDIATQHETGIQHVSLPTDRVRHSVRIDPASHLGRIVGTSEIDVNSSHHQAVRILGEGLVATARAADGIIEGLEDPAHPFYLGVQWHPEDMTEESSAASIFKAFIDAARAHRATQNEAESSPHVAVASE